MHSRQTRSVPRCARWREENSSRGRLTRQAEHERWPVLLLAGGALAVVATPPPPPRDAVGWPSLRGARESAVRGVAGATSSKVLRDLWDAIIRRR